MKVLQSVNFENFLHPIALTYLRLHAYECRNLGIFEEQPSDHIVLPWLLPELYGYMGSDPEINNNIGVSWGALHISYCPCQYFSIEIHRGKNQGDVRMIPWEKKIPSLLIQCGYIKLQFLPLLIQGGYITSFF